MTIDERKVEFWLMLGYRHAILGAPESSRPSDIDAVLTKWLARDEEMDNDELIEAAQIEAARIVKERARSSDGRAESS